MASYGRQDSVEYIERGEISPEVYGFFPDGYFELQEADEMEAIPTCFWQGDHVLDQPKDPNPKPITKQRKRNRKSVNYVTSGETSFFKKHTYHYLPAPGFVVNVGNHLDCEMVGPTWVFRSSFKKWVMLKRTCYNRVLTSLFFKGFTQSGPSEYTAKSTSSRVLIVRLFDFFSPLMHGNDPRFFWVQTIFSVDGIDRKV